MAHKNAKAAGSIEPSSSSVAASVELSNALLNLLAATPFHGAKSADEQKPQDCSADEWAGHVVDAFLDRTCARFPKPKSQCPFTGLNRNQLYELTKGKHSPIRTVSLKKPGERSGARFFFVGDALRHLRDLATEQAAEGAPSSLPVNKIRQKYGGHS